MTTLPNFDTATFKPGTPIDNLYFPLKPGTISVYEGEPADEEAGEEIEETIKFAVTFQTRDVAGIAATVARETAWANGFCKRIRTTGLPKIQMAMSGIWVKLLHHLSMTTMAISLEPTTTVLGKQVLGALYQAT